MSPFQLFTLYVSRTRSTGRLVQSCRVPEMGEQLPMGADWGPTSGHSHLPSSFWYGPSSHPVQPCMAEVALQSADNAMTI